MDRTGALQNCMSLTPKRKDVPERGFRVQGKRFSFNNMAERVGFVFALMPKDFGSSRFVTSPKSYQKWAKSSVQNVAEIADIEGVPKDDTLRLAGPDGVQVGASVSEVLAAFVTTLATVPWEPAASQERHAGHSLRYCPFTPSVGCEIGRLVSSLNRIAHISSLLFSKIS
jgi:hypothetical protein